MQRRSDKLYKQAKYDWKRERERERERERDACISPPSVMCLRPPLVGVIQMVEYGTPFLSKHQELVSVLRNDELYVRSSSSYLNLFAIYLKLLCISEIM